MRKKMIKFHLTYMLCEIIVAGYFTFALLWYYYKLNFDLGKFHWNAVAEERKFYREQCKDVKNLNQKCKNVINNQIGSWLAIEFVIQIMFILRRSVLVLLWTRAKSFNPVDIVNYINRVSMFTLTPLEIIWQAYFIIFVFGLYIKTYRFDQDENLKYLLLPIVFYGWAYFILLVLIIIMFSILIIGGIKSGRWSLNKSKINEYKILLDQKD